IAARGPEPQPVSRRRKHRPIKKVPVHPANRVARVGRGESGDEGPPWLCAWGWSVAEEESAKGTPRPSRTTTTCGLPLAGPGRHPGGLPAVGEKGIDLVGWRRRQARQHVLQVRPRLDAQALTRGRKAEEHGGRLAAARRPNSQPVFSANSYPLPLTLGGV